MRRNQDLNPVRSEQRYGLSPWSGSSLLDPSTFFGTSPWHSMRRMQEEMDRLFGQFFQPMGMEMQRMAQQWAPSVDISQDDGEWLIEAELPGVNKDQIHTEMYGNQLVIRAEMRQEQETKPQGAEGQQSATGDGQGQASQRQYHHRERRYGYFERVLPLPENVDQEKVHCEFRDGVLKIHLPKRAEQKQRSRRIPITEGPTQQLAESAPAQEAKPAEAQAGKAQSKAMNGTKSKEPVAAG